ncbi:MAG: substrate-binding domain-containing protein [Bacteroidota bacterium]|nr:substrate-binding domain-containing protein [Bacteroidota bacterium]MDP4213780.1 substrate-binding domain-containing protein [Bacteroidota bacterium]MDP4251690.1 substrate-binding domain-containing protein [Bacteroidota bacterium]
MERKVSIKDIAKQVGVSTALVSYVLNNKEKEARVGKEVAEKVRRAARKLNYQPNLIARSLQSGRTQTLGLIVADISNPFFSYIARVIEDAANQHGYTVIIGSSDEQASKSATLIGAFLNRQVDGLIIAPAEQSEKQLRTLLNDGFPFVLIDRYFPGLSANSVHIDNYRSAYDASEHLIRKGYRRIAMVAYETALPHMQERIRGYLAALKANGIRTKRNWMMKTGFTNLDQDVQTGLRKMLDGKERPDAFFFATNSLAVAGLKYIYREGIRVPEELGIISFDESDVFDFFYAPVTYVRQSIEDIGKTALDLLMKQMKNPNGKKEQILIDTKLIIRKSTARTEIKTIK